MKLLRNETAEIEKKVSVIDTKTDEIVVTTKAMASKQNKPLPPKNVSPFNTLKNFKQMNAKFSSPISILSYANVARMNVPMQSAKRKRSDEMPAKKMITPPATSGTKTNFTGLSVVQKPKRIEKPIFKRAIWVSRLSPETTEDEIKKYVTENTPINDTNRFNVFKLVKKDRDLTTLRFISYKIEVNDDDFVVLSDPDIWPKDVMVREFLRNKNLGDYFPNLNTVQKNRENFEEKMNTNVAKKSQSPKNSPKMSSTTKTTPTKVTETVDLMSI